MSRELKFRVWDVDNRKFLSNMSGIGLYVEGKLFKDNDYSNKYFIFQQFTGLKDKNGIEVYEGDIVRIPCFTYSKNSNSPTGIEYDITVCEFDSSGARFILKTLPISSGLGGFDFHNGMSDKTEIIGNIYEHSELLNKLNADLKPFQTVTDEEILKYLKIQKY